MADDTEKQHKKLARLMSSLGDLEKELAPLLSQSLPETAIGLDTIQQAKLHVLVPYLCYDLVFVYLKTRGIDPQKHPVVAELARIKEYFGKVKDAENVQSTRTSVVDKAAAARFINHAIAQVKYGAEAVDATPGAGPSNQSSEPYVPRVTEKMLERAQWESEVREEMEREGEREDTDEALEIFDEDPTQVESSDDTRKGTGKTVEVDVEQGKAGRKRRRQAVDFFDGALRLYCVYMQSDMHSSKMTQHLLKYRSPQTRLLSRLRRKRRRGSLMPGY
ncbi:hypothetical protein K488DRAFT_59986 [Vararia minispora EC-137]|uniref:Uncharacterized protein n=1 Tax=Vararia minispora EC-137 TaxID=1314806 RepID=A0ACB8Q833_9AGAM|nr:hypothetical protein K488DRAFT_59986 [Vararia minispora EC-137]